MQSQTDAQTDTINREILASAEAVRSSTISLFKSMFSAFSWCVLVFFRYKYGERTLNIMVVGICCIFMLLLYGIFFLFGSDSLARIGMTGDSAFSASGWIWLHLELFFIISLIHLAYTWYRTRIEDEDWYSKSRGLSWLYKLAHKIGLHNYPIYIKGKRVFTVRQHTFWMYVEPLILIIISIIFMVINPYYGAFLFVCSFSLAIREYFEFMKHRNKILNIKDGDIESEFLSELVDKGTVGEGTVEDAKGYDDYGAIFQRDKLKMKKRFTVKSMDSYKGYNLHKLTPEELNPN